ncbi:MAG: hypothetical protein M3Z02_08125 [Actinomycetota bacterium]|nr:hypothetical protein [Actinomycetota bacterium]
MSVRTRGICAWSVASAALLGVAGVAVLAGANGSSYSGALVLLPVAVLSFAGTGALLVSRRPENVVGVLLLGVGVSMLMLLGGQEYALFAIKTSPGTLPGGAVVAAVTGVAYAPLLVSLAVWLPLVFPTGRLLGRRWRIVGWSGAVFLVLAMVGNGLSPDSTEVTGIGVVESPFALHGVKWLLEGLLMVSAIALFFGLGGALTSMVLRFRRAGVAERQQIKLVCAALSLTPLPFLLHDWAPRFSQPVFAVVLPLVPAAVAVAILRYRLFDIDRLISRTVSYALVTGLLIAVYAGLVTVASRLLPTGNSVAVAASTLAVAGLFQPLRRRVQVAVDLRFNRAKYDAERTVDAFSRRLRSEVDLETVRADLLSVVGQTLQPTRAGIWLSGAAGTKP